MSKDDDMMSLDEVIAHIMRVRRVSRDVAETMLLEKLREGKIRAFVSPRSRPATK